VHIVEQYIQDHPEELADAYHQLHPLKTLEIELRLDWRCNAKCKYCGVWKYSREGMLPVGAWMRIISDLAECGLGFVLFTGGEPLLYPHFLDVISHADSLGVQSAVITNGSLLNRARVHRLSGLRHLREITVSLDSPEASVHDEVRKFKGLFGVAAEGMCRVRQMVPHVRLAVNTVVTSDTAATVKDLLKLPVLPDKIRVFPVGLDMPWLESLASVPADGWSQWAREAKTQYLPAETRDRVRHEVARLQEEARGLGVQIETERLDWGKPYDGLCVVPLAHLVLQPDGDVYPCCHVQDPTNRIGRLSVQSVREVFASAEYKDFLASLRPVRLAACRSCSRYRAVNQSAAQLLAEVGAIASGPGGIEHGASRGQHHHPDVRVP
jgi:radical SAM protein with 4Fe4S-binding SPASM domain